MDLKTVTSKGTKYQPRKRIGRGIGSGSGKTSGRGHKGQGSRSGASRKPGFEGGQMPLYRRVPKRGFTNARFRTEYTIVNVRDLEVFDSGSVVDLDAILAKGLTSLETKLLKVLGMGDLTKKLTVKAQKFSKSAADKIVAAGGEVIELGERGQVSSAEEAPKKKAAKKKAASAKAPAEEASVEPAAEEPAAEEAAVEEPAVEEPAVEEPVAEEPAAEEPAAEEPAAEEPAAEEAPVVEETPEVDTEEEAGETDA